MCSPKVKNNNGSQNSIPKVESNTLDVKTTHQRSSQPHSMSKLHTESRCPTGSSSATRRLQFAQAAQPVSAPSVPSMHTTYAFFCFILNWVVVCSARAVRHMESPCGGTLYSFSSLATSRRALTSFSGVAAGIHTWLVLSMLRVCAVNAVNATNATQCQTVPNSGASTVPTAFQHALCCIKLNYV